MAFRPLHDRVLVRRVEAEAKTAGGIIIPDTAKEKPQEGEVVAVGTGARNDSGQVTPLEVKAGDTVLTSGLGGSYPAGLLIGRISKVEGGALDTFKSAEIEPAVRLSNLEDVAILTSFQPLKLGTP